MDREGRISADYMQLKYVHDCNVISLFTKGNACMRNLKAI